jgi:replication-associated recombination protein RarA
MSLSASSTFWVPGKLLRRLLAADRLGSVIFYGPPGTGKTTLAQYLLAQATRSKFRQLSAVASGVKELREVLDEARDRLSTTGSKTLLFIDEIHRFNKSQQDVLLPDVEEGVVVLVGATTQNPFFALNSALVSRSRVFQFEPLSVDDVKGSCAGRSRTKSAGWAITTCASTTMPRLSGRGERRRRPPGAGRAGSGRALDEPAADRLHAGVGQRIGAAQSRWTTIATVMPITTRPAH